MLIKVVIERLNTRKGKLIEAVMKFMKELERGIIRRRS